MKMSDKSNKKQREIYYVYGHYTNDNKLFYIGVGKVLNYKTKKITQKFSRAFHFSNRNTFWNRVKNKYGIQVKILFEYNNKEDALNKEKELILKYGRRWLKQGFLTNITEGGEIGPTGRFYKMSEEQKKKLSELKSITLYVYNNKGEFLKSIKTIKATANYCGVTYNAIQSCLKTKNYSNNYLIFKEYKGEKLNYTVDDLNFKPTLSKKVVIENSIEKLEFDSISDCAKYLKLARESVRDALKRNGKCKKYKIYLKDNQQPRP